MKYLFFLFLAGSFLMFSCNGGPRNENSQSDQEEALDPEPLPEGENTADFQTFSSDEWQIRVEFPSEYEVYEGQLPGESPVVNIYDTANLTEPPYAIHEEPTLGYIAILPEGYGVDAPAGKQVSYEEGQGDLPLSFEVDASESRIYLLENDEPWAYSLRLENPPESWGRYATVFVHLRVEDFKAECLDRNTGEVKPMSSCDPLSGEDEVKYTGNLDSESAEELTGILESLELQ